MNLNLLYIIHVLCNLFELSRQTITTACMVLNSYRTLNLLSSQDGIKQNQVKSFFPYFSVY